MITIAERNNFKKSMLLLCFIGVSSFKEQSPVFKAGYSPVSQQVEKPFLVGAMFNGRDVNYTYSDFFKFNTWHYYTGMTSSGFQFGWPGLYGAGSTGEVRILYI
ncbi:hypothetical protein FBQ84_07210 [Ignavibacteria bacterium CHB1]|nr:hypothetical protein [Ignavibacteria bacterium CHB1]